MNAPHVFQAEGEEKVGFARTDHAVMSQNVACWRLHNQPGHVNFFSSSRCLYRIELPPPCKSAEREDS